MIIASYVLMAIGLLCMFLGLVGMFRYPKFYPRILVASKIDTVGVLSILLGVMLRHGLSFFTLRVGLLLLLILISGPMIAHLIARSAYLSGNRDGVDTVSHVPVSDENEEDAA